MSEWLELSVGLTSPVWWLSSRFGTCGTWPTAGSYWAEPGSSRTPVAQVKGREAAAGSRAGSWRCNSPERESTSLYRLLETRPPPSGCNPARPRFSAATARRRTGNCWGSVRKTCWAALRTLPSPAPSGTAEPGRPGRSEQSPGSKTSRPESPFWTRLDPCRRGGGDCWCRGSFRKFASQSHSTCWGRGCHLCRPFAAALPVCA